MMEIKDKVISNLITIGYYWIGYPNHILSYSIFSMISQIDNLNKDQQKKIDDFHHDWKTIFADKQNDPEIKDVIIPPQYINDENTKLLWIASQSIMNLIATGDFEMAYIHLIELGEEWNELYANIIGMIRKTEFKIPFSQWLITHMLVAFDINGKSEMEFAGYEIRKKD